ncbi:Disease resistance protein RPP13 [Vitis vinifera]|uniref:Disease resistance protein RPP13 n=1 Tax=Vitis vinifera TaxID=29760 RepID=A0A438C7F9_VITVI|nr:Disease resistance protein RPP13 [Vitis vinifera]
MNKIHTSSIPKQRKGNWTNLGGDSTFSAELHSLCSAAQSLASKYAVWEKCLPKDCLQSYMLLIIRFGLDLQRWDFVEFDDFLRKQRIKRGYCLCIVNFKGFGTFCLKRTSPHPRYPNDPNEEYALPASAVYTDCLIFSEKHPIQSTKFLLPFYNLFHFLFLKRTKEVLVRIKGELGPYPCIEDSNGSPDHGQDQESQSHDPENQSQGFKDIAIVGIGGSGKTALARQLFYDEHIQGAFFPTLWISLSGKIDAGIDFKQVVEDMLVELTTEHGHEKLRSCSTEELLSSLGRQLLGKKYLIVLDGIWDETRDWYFRLGQALNWPDKDCNIQFGRDQRRNGNAVIITTRLEEVAKGMVGDKYLHSIEGIGEDEIWSMFNDAADKSKLNPQQNDKLKKLQNEIVKLCDGFPLGVKTLAEIIPKKLTEIIPGTLATDPSSVNAEPERGHIDSDHYSAIQNHRGDTLTEIIPMEVQIDGGGLHCPKTLRHPLASKVAGRLGSKQSWAKKRREPNNIMAFIHWLASLAQKEGSPISFR